MIKISADTVKVEIVLYAAGRTDTLRKNLASKNDEFAVSGDSIFLSVPVNTAVLAGVDSVKVRPIFLMDQSVHVKGQGNPLIGGTTTSSRYFEAMIKSEPGGADVYLVPKFIWKKRPEKEWLGLSPNDLMKWRVGQKRTPVSAQVQEYVYIALFQSNGKTGFTEYAPARSLSDNSLTFYFPQKK